MSHYGADTVIYSVFPLNHMSAKCMTLLTGLYSNGCAIIDAHFSASRFWERCRQERISAFNYVGALLMMLFKQPPTLADRDHGVRLARGGGVPPELRQGFEQRFGVRLLEMYGMTEFRTSPATSGLVSDAPDPSGGQRLITMSGSSMCETTKSHRDLSVNLSCALRDPTPRCFITTGHRIRQ